VDSWNVSTLGFTNQVMHFVAVRTHPAAKRQNVLLYAIGFIEAIV
jgi:hypothetical protein